MHMLLWLLRQSSIWFLWLESCWRCEFDSCWWCEFDRDVGLTPSTLSTTRVRVEYRYLKVEVHEVQTGALSSLSRIRPVFWWSLSDLFVLFLFPDRISSATSDLPVLEYCPHVLGRWCFPGEKVKEATEGKVESKTATWRDVTLGGWVGCRQLSYVHTMSSNHKPSELGNDPSGLRI